MAGYSKNELVKYDNDFNLSTNFNKLSKIQQDIFFSGISYLVQNRKTHVIIPAEDIKQRAHLSKNRYSREVYYDLIHGIEDIVLHTVFMVHEDGKEWKGVLFDTFALDEKTGNFEMWLNPHASRYFFDIPGNFTWYELEVFLRLHSRFEQILFRGFLAHYGGFWKLTAPEIIDCFKLEDSDPKKTKQNLANFITRLKKTYLKHVKETGYFDSVDDPEIIRKHAKGAPIESIIFRFAFNSETRDALPKSKNPHYANEKKVFVIQKHESKKFSQDGKGGVIVNSDIKEEKVRKLCPHCKAPLRRNISQKSGKEYYYCENSQKWGLGNKTCTYFHWRGDEDKDDIIE